MNAACMFWDSKRYKSLSYNPATGNWKAISTDDEFARARQFTSIYNDELSRLNKEYGEKARGKIIPKGLLFNDVGRDFDVFSCNKQYVYYISTDNKMKLAVLNRDRFT